MCALVCQDAKNKNVEDIVILSGDHLYRMDYMDFVQVPNAANPVLARKEALKR